MDSKFSLQVLFEGYLPSPTFSILLSCIFSIIGNTTKYTVYSTGLYCLLNVCSVKDEMHKTIDMILIQAIFKEFINEHFK